ncbi:MAG: hypothetical protein MJ231_09050 [bacterium]|nr:hypothetical protein [bacterium]
MSDNRQYCYRAHSSNNPDVYIYSLDTIPTNETPIYIEGVIANISGSNIHSKKHAEGTRFLVLQEVVDGKQQTLRVMAQMPDSVCVLGQKLLIRVDGLAIGKNTNQIYLCSPKKYEAADIINQQKVEQKVGWAPGEILAKDLCSKVWRIGSANPNAIVRDIISINDYINILGVEARQLDGHIVTVKNVHFTGQLFGTSADDKVNCYGEPSTSAYAATFAPTTAGLNYPQQRIFKEYNNDYFSQTSCYEDMPLALVKLPDSKYEGEISGVLTYIWDNPVYNPDLRNWSISIENTTDLNLKTWEDETWQPILWFNPKYTCEQIANKLNGMAFEYTYSVGLEGCIGEGYLGFTKDSIYRWYANVKDGKAVNGGYMKGTYTIDNLYRQDTGILWFDYYEKQYAAVGGGYTITQDFEAQRQKWHDPFEFVISKLMEQDSLIVFYEGIKCKNMLDIYYNPFTPVIK